MNILQSIFTDYYELHPRPAVIENVNKMIHCGDPSYGGAMYGCPHSPKSKEYPYMIEIFSRNPDFIILEDDAVLTPLPIDDEISSLSAILLNEAYYELLKTGQMMVDGIPVLSPTCLIPFKAKAWLDLKERKLNGEQVDSKNIWKLDDGSKAVDSVTVVLLRDGKEYQRVELSKQNGWTYIWTELSDRYTWTVIEVDIPDGFTSTISQEGNLWTITNDDNPKIPVDPIDPTEPNEPTDPSNPDDTKPPQTGDAGNLGLWFVLMAVSTAGLGSVILLQKRRRSKVK